MHWKFGFRPAEPKIIKIIGQARQGRDAPPDLGVKKIGDLYSNASIKKVF